MLNVIASFLIAVLMGMGVGGGGLFVIYLTLCLNYPQALGQGTNLLFFVVAGAFSLIYHLRHRKIVPLNAVIMIAFGGLGSVISSHLLNFIDTGYAKIALAILLIVSGGMSLYNSYKK